MPLRGRDAGSAKARINARGVKLAVAEGVNLTADADLEASYRPARAPSGQKNLPDVKGTVSSPRSATRGRSCSRSTLTQLGQEQRAPNVDTYDPANDVVRFNAQRRLAATRSASPTTSSTWSSRSSSPGSCSPGTNQRFGARGCSASCPTRSSSSAQQRVRGAGGLRPLRRSDADRAQGRRARDDRVPPLRVERRAGQRRPRDRGRGSDVATNPGADDGGSFGASRHLAHQPPRPRRRREPQGRPHERSGARPGGHRAPLDRRDDARRARRGAASALGESVGLEALSSLTGADKAVKKVVPVIDEFRFGSGYSSLAGQIEPTVTLGKRITENVRGDGDDRRDREPRGAVEHASGSSEPRG